MFRGTLNPNWYLTLCENVFSWVYLKPFYSDFKHDLHSAYASAKRFICDTIINKTFFQGYGVIFLYDLCWFPCVLLISNPWN